ncbi:probable LRR receptor-like serine/threonine-protein kinase At3g47570 [Ziziphus jujuba]|uniref:Probable LRR receptor-like serine/threonine-protein kinase At3g47570 n=1 Tax=Ziziphus jujuba TaxID=326968 RepID=A0A6P3ZPR6_ZIZJJ|nr:probable LRR receptor-like serine/threonine-protein kinase At3g47570 [Ziziphus jujuba]
MAPWSLRFYRSLFLSNFFFCVNLLSQNSISINTIAISTLGNDSDKVSLLTLKSDLVAGGSTITGALSSWNDSVHFCQWQGVTCGHRHERVTVLKLGDQGLSCTIPSSIRNLTFLRRLNLSNNDLHGIIPKEIGWLSRLEHLDLSRNSLEGAIPVELANCTTLKNITLHHNNLRGGIPFQLGTMLGMYEMWLGYNGLTGSIPSSLGNLSSLRLLSLRRNTLEGSIPRDIGRLKSLEYIELTENNLSGILPSSFCNLSSLIQIRLIDNQFSGDLPNIGLCFPRLYKIGLGVNQFTGTIPSSITNISGIEVFDVGENRLNGRVPENMGFLQGMKWLSLGSNNLGSGKEGDLRFLVSLTNLSSLRVLAISNNHFGGALPTSIANLSTQLITFALERNEIYGSIHAGIENLLNLSAFTLGRNYLTGKVPSSIGKLQKLGILGLEENMLSGSIPPSLGNLTQLIEISLAVNYLNGSLPLSLTNCTNVQTLSLPQNKFSSNIPSQFFDSFDELIFLQLHQNSFTGFLPAGVGNLKNLQEFSLHDNNLSGEIPKELGNCPKLEVLLMGGNYFQGHVPPSLSLLVSIQILDLSLNNLSGMLPKDLQSLRGLRSLNLSFNQLEGEVPTGGIFSNVSGVFITGNRKLCGGIPALKLPACSMLESRRPNSTRPSLAVIFVIIFIGVVVFSSLVIFIINRRSPKGKSTPSPYQGVNEHYRISYKELHKATEGFASPNLIGMGSFGSVYKGILNEEEHPIAVKVLNLRQCGAPESFVAECEALRRIRHRNLLKIITSCSSVDFEGNDFMALVFEFMPNGSLENWMHVNFQHHTKSLNLVQRLNIGIDVASALNYLHYHCQPPIVHCDLKPSNILLDSDFSAHLADFGLAKLLFEADENFSKALVSSAAVRGSIGYITPEYGMGSDVSIQGDVYSYGILVLEMVTGKRPTDEMFKDGQNLHGLCKMAYPEAVQEIVDPYLLNTELYEDTDIAKVSSKLMDCLVSIVQVGLACSAESPTDRMDIKDALVKMQRTKKAFIGNIIGER